MVQVKHTDAVNSDTGIWQVCCWTSDRKTFLGPIAISESFRCPLCTVHGLSVRMYCTHVQLAAYKATGSQRFNFGICWVIECMCFTVSEPIWLQNVCGFGTRDCRVIESTMFYGIEACRAIECKCFTVLETVGLQNVHVLQSSPYVIIIIVVMIADLQLQV